jgi:hypothetical protein
MCALLLPPGVKPIAVKKIYHIIKKYLELYNEKHKYGGSYILLFNRLKLAGNLKHKQM